MEYTNGMELEIVIDQSNKMTFKNNRISNITLGIENANKENTPSFGIIGKYGSVDILNVDDELINLVNNKKLNSETKVIFKYREKILSQLNIENISIESDTRIMTLSLTDETMKFDEMEIEPIEKQSGKSMLDLFEYLFGLTGLADYSISDSLKSTLKSRTNFPYYSGKKTTLKTLINAFCEANLVNMFINSKSELEVVEYV